MEHMHNASESEPALDIHGFIEKYDNQTSINSEQARADFDAVIQSGQNRNATCLLMESRRWPLVDALGFESRDWQQLSRELNLPGLVRPGSVLIPANEYIRMSNNQEAARILVRGLLDAPSGEATDDSELVGAYGSLISLAFLDDPYKQAAFQSAVFSYAPDRHQPDRWMLHRQGRGQLEPEVGEQLKTFFEKEGQA